MAPARRRTRAMLVFAALLALVVVGLAWFLVREDDPTGGVAAGPPLTTVDPADQAGAGTATTAPGGTAAEGGSPAGGDDAPGTSGPPAPPAPPCERVLSEAEAASALGTAVAQVERRDGFLVRSCVYWTSGDRYLVVHVHRGVSASRDRYELSRLPTDRPVAGIGQAASWTPDSGLLDVLDGAARFQVGLFTTGRAPYTDSPPAAVQAAARAVAARL
jgi:hypothetical protein